MKSKAVEIYAYLSAFFIFVFCFFLLIYLGELWDLTLSYMGFSDNATWANMLFWGVAALVLVISFKNLLGPEQTVRGMVGLMNLLTICFCLPFLSDLVAQDRAIDRITTTTDDVGYGAEGNSISFSEAQDYVEKINTFGKAELDFLRTRDEITKKHRPETLWEKAFGWALFALPASVFIYGNALLLFLSRDELSRPLKSQSESYLGR